MSCRHNRCQSREPEPPKPWLAWKISADTVNGKIVF
jgi:hypothetical protein